MKRVCLISLWKSDIQSKRQMSLKGMGKIISMLFMYPPVHQKYDYVSSDVNASFLLIHQSINLDITLVWEWQSLKAQTYSEKWASQYIACHMIIKSMKTNPYQVHLVTAVKQGTSGEYAKKRPVLDTITLKQLGLVHTIYSGT